MCDPYFTLDSLDLLKVIRTEKATCDVHILSSKKEQGLSTGIPFEEAFRSHWRTSISDQDPGPTSITLMSTRNSRKFPIHDRWLLTQNGGLRLGTSTNSLGLLRLSEVSELTPEEAREREGEIDKFHFLTPGSLAAKD